MSAIEQPASPGEVVEIVRAARAAKRTVSVGGATAGVAIDTARMVQVLHLDETSLLAHAQAGLTLGALEERLNARGLTLGALPPASRERTVGAALAAPRPSEATPRGRLADACAALDAVLADGALIHTRLAPRRATGPDLSRALIGARGATGVIVAAWLRLARLPPSRAWAAWAFAGGEKAIAAARALLDRGARPADLSVADGAVASRVIGDAVAAGEALLAIRFEGVAAMVDAERALASALCDGARSLADAPAEAWLRGRGTVRQDERAVSMQEIAWKPGIELTGWTPAGAAIVGDRANAADRIDPMTLALAKELDPDGVFSTGA